MFCAATLWCVAARGAFTKTGTITSSSANTTLQDGTIYFLESSSVTLTGGNANWYASDSNADYDKSPGSYDAKCGLRVAEHAMVAICLRKGETLKVQGGNGNGMIPGAPGILVPGGSTLIVFGDGTLDVKGGNGCSGQGGGDGGSGWVDDGKDCEPDDYGVGKGGRGGAGGGGAAAAIGTYGGRGGTYGGIGGYIERSCGDNTGTVAKDRSTLNGHGGGSGYAASMQGNVYCLGFVTVKGSAGAAGDKSGSGGNAGGHETSQGAFTDRYCAGGGGGGGGGGKGAAARFAIGAGGAGGGGGGGGGSGGLCDRSHGGSERLLCGVGGKGGEDGGQQGGYGSQGNWHKHDPEWEDGDQCNTGTCSGSSGYAYGGQAGGGGSGGANDEGMSRYIFRASTATVTASHNGEHLAESHSQLFFTMTFANASLKNSRVCYGEYPNSLTTVPSKTGYAFLGFFEKENGEGIQYIASDGESLTPYYGYSDFTVYAYWVKLEDMPWTGVTINGRDAAYRSAKGWKWSHVNYDLRLWYRGEMQWVFAGTNTDNRINVVQQSRGKVRLDGLHVERSKNTLANGLFCVTSGVESVLIVDGASTLKMKDGVYGPALNAMAGSTLVITNYGGTVNPLRLTGGQGGAGIEVQGTVEMARGRIFAKGGKNSAGVGHGSSLNASGGTFRMAGGTLETEAGSGDTAGTFSPWDFGKANGGKDVTLEIVGGSLRCVHGTCSPQPKNGKGENVWCIRTAVPDSPGDDVPVAVTNLFGTGDNPYNTTQLFPINDRLYLWQPNATHNFKVNGMDPWAVVKNADTNAYYAVTGVLADGWDVGVAAGEGWRWSPVSSNWTFRTAEKDDVTLQGKDAKGAVHPRLEGKGTVTFAKLTLYGWGVKDGVVEVVSNAEVTVKLKDSNVVGPMDDGVLEGFKQFSGAGVFVGQDALLTVQLANAGGAGDLTVTGGNWGPGIGGVGGERGFFKLASGSLTVTGGFEGAGIGGGSGTDGMLGVRFDGGSATVRGGPGGAGVGAGAWRADGGIFISGGIENPTVLAGEWAQPVGAGFLDLGLAADDVAAGGGSPEVAELTEDALRAAVGAAKQAKGGVVTFKAGLEGELKLSRPILLDTTGFTRPLTIDGANRVRLKPASSTPAGTEKPGAFHNLGSGMVGFVGVAFEGFQTKGCGGAIRTQGPLALTNCTFTGCVALGYGGAVYAAASNKVDAFNCRFEKNRAGKSGGGLYSRSRTVVARSCFVENEAKWSGGGMTLNAPGFVHGIEHCSAFGNATNARGGGFDFAGGTALVGACTLSGNGGGGMHVGERLVTVSTVAVGDETYVAPRPHDVDVDSRAEMVSCGSSFGRSSAMRAQGMTSFVGIEPSAMFKFDYLSTTNVNGVVQSYRGVTSRNKSIVQGCAVWHPADWSGIGWSARTTDAQGTLVWGTAAARVFCKTDQIGRTRTNDNLFVGAVTDAAEKESLVVTTADDRVDPEDNLTSLREALSVVTSRDQRRRTDGYAEVTFAATLFTNAARSVTLTAGGNPLALTGVQAAAIVGPTDGSSLTIAPSDDLLALFTVGETACLELQNLTLVPNAKSNYATVRSGGDFTAINCAFDGRGAGCNKIESTGNSVFVHQCTIANNVRNTKDSNGSFLSFGGREGHLLNCTLAGNRTAGGDLVYVRSGTFDVLCCTMAENDFGAGWGIRALNAECDGQKTTYAVNCALVGDHAYSGFDVDAAAHYTTFGKPYAECFDGGAQTGFVNGVTHRYYRQLRGGAIHTNGCFVFRSSEYRHVGTSLFKSGNAKKAVRGLSNRADSRVGTDILRREVVQGHVSRGSYATCCDPEYFDGGVIWVNTAEDVVDPDDYDGLIALREAVDFAQANATFRDEAGNCTIQFDNAFFGGKNERTITSRMRQMEVAKSFQNGSLVIAPPAGKRILLDGARTFRPLYVGPGNHVSISGFTFTNAAATPVGKAVSTGAGGGLLNAGYTTVSNCTFVDCWAGATFKTVTNGVAWDVWSASTVTNEALRGVASWALDSLYGHSDGGGASTASGGSTLFLDCTFKDCAAARGGGLHTADGGTSTVVNCTFHGCVAARSATIPSPAGGGVYAAGTKSRTALVNCTVAGNGSNLRTGGVHAEGSRDRTTLYLLNTVVSGNLCASGAADLQTDHGSAHLNRVLYGERQTGIDDLWVDEEVLAAAPDELFSAFDARGLPAAARFSNEHVTHAAVPLKTMPTGAAWAWFTPDFANAYYGDGKDALFGASRLKYVANVKISRDQTGRELSSPIYGSCAGLPASLLSAAPPPEEETPEEEEAPAEAETSAEESPAEGEAPAEGEVPAEISAPPPVPPPSAAPAQLSAPAAPTEASAPSEETEIPTSPAAEEEKTPAKKLLAASGVQTQTVDGVSWLYTVQDGQATVGTGADGGAATNALSGAVTVPSSLGGNAVAAIAARAFAGCSEMTAITLPDTMASVASDAFAGCAKLTSVAYPAPLGTPAAVFPGRCAALESVSLTKCADAHATDAFIAGCGALTNLVYKDGVANVPAGAFTNQDTLASVSFPSSLRTVGELAFLQRESLRSVELSSGLQSVGSWAFAVCPNLRTVSVSSGAFTVGEKAFALCEGLENADFLAGATELGEDAFRECSRLRRATLGNGLRAISDGAFDSCTNLSEIVWPAALESVGEDAFRDCAALTSLALPNTVSNVSEYAFSGCSGLASLTLPTALRQIESMSFSYCGMASLAIPATIESVADGAFAGCSNLTEIAFAGNAEVAHGAFSDCANVQRLTIPFGMLPLYDYFDYFDAFEEVVLLSGGAKVPDYAFVGCAGLTSLPLPAGVTEIGAFAFSGCTGLTDAAIPNGVTALGEGAFQNCTGMASATIPNGVKTVPAGAFSGCENLRDLSLPGSVETIGANAFADCALERVALPAGIKNIDPAAFAGCASIRDVTLPVGAANISAAFPDSVGGITNVVFAPGSSTSIGADVLSGCVSLRRVFVPATVVSLADSLFADANALEAVDVEPGNAVFVSVGGVVYDKALTRLLVCPRGLSAVALPSTLKGISETAFANCTGLTSLSIPASVTDIAQNAFRTCPRLANLTVPSTISALTWLFGDNSPALTNVVVLSGATELPEGFFAGASSLRSVALPSTLATIGNSMFWQCYALETVTIPSGVTTISDYAFADCRSLLRMVLPDCVVNMGENVLSGCISLKDVVWSAGLPSIPAGMFDGCESLENVTLPATVTNLDAEAFLGCNNITNVLFKGAMPVCNGAFDHLVNAFTVTALYTGAPKAFPISSEWTSDWTDNQWKFFYGATFPEVLVHYDALVKNEEDGSRRYVWQDYVAGTSPFSPDDYFRLVITRDAAGNITFSNEKFADDPEAEALRAYQLWGARASNPNWWTYIGRSDEVSQEVLHNYDLFRATIEMK
ncbi:MAG: leucine-rich repeat domain-containing protein [Kiritimatiellae bacterium]|nr:leucine-rich repeat domain-containing protein [Kiritimatiellia bacterium]